MADWLAANAATVKYQVLFNHLSGWTGDHRLASYANAQSRYKARFGLPAPGADTVLPAVALTAPLTNAQVRGQVRVAANASDAGGVAGVQFKRNGVNIGAEDRYAPFELTWNTAAVANGKYTITAVARDVAQNTSTSAGRKVTVRN